MSAPPGGVRSENGGTAMSFERLEELAKESALECKHIGHRIHMSAALATRLMQRYQPELADEDLTRLRNAVFGAPLLHELMGIPIINDVGMQGSPTLWILVDPTGEEVERGNVPAICPECLGNGDYWTEWSDAGERMAERGEIIVLCRSEPPDGTVCIQCHTCKGNPDAYTPESSPERKASGTATE